MIRISTLISPPTKWTGTRQTRTASEIVLADSVLSRIPRGSSGDHIQIFSETTGGVETASPASRIRLLIGPPSLADVVDDMNHFLISKAIGGDEFRTVEPGTLEKFATFLRYYAEWLAEHWYPSDPSNHYLNMRSPHSQGRPTYAYRKFVLNLPGIASSTKNNRVSAMRAFYEHLEFRGVITGIDAKNYQKLRSTYLQTSSTKGVAIRKGIQVSDLQIPHGKSASISTLNGTVLDGGTVRPLSDVELKIVMGVLKNLDNPVLRLTAYLALNCGVRLQTALTLRRSHARRMLEHVRDKVSHVAIPVGGTHVTQAKAGREYVVQVPTRVDAMIVPCRDLLGRARSVGELLGEYEASPHALLRYKKAKATRQRLSLQSNDEDEYLFLGRNGMPFYLHSDDPLNSLRKSARRGESFKDSMKSTLAPKVVKAARESGCTDLADAGLGFHDFRGTFAEQNLLKTSAICVENGMKRIQAEEVALRQTQRLLGHSNIESTYRYLHFRDEHSRLLEANELYAHSLMGERP